MNKIYLLLGSNIGDSQLQFSVAIKNIEQKIGTLIRQSKLYSTAAWGDTRQPDFLNQVILVETALTPLETMQTILAIEKEMGRVRTLKNAPRIIDIDILFFNKVILDEPTLTLPHPEIQNRRFVLIPLNELAPNFHHPVLGLSVHELLKICPDRLTVKKF